MSFILGATNTHAGEHDPKLTLSQSLYSSGNQDKSSEDVSQPLSAEMGEDLLAEGSSLTFSHEPYSLLAI